MMRVRYDESADAVYVYLLPEDYQVDGKLKTKQGYPVNLDFTEEGWLFGVEIREADSIMDAGYLEKIGVMDACDRKNLLREELVDLFVSEIKDLPKIKREVNILLQRISSPFKESGKWMIDNQQITEMEVNAKQILEALMPLTQVPVGVGDAFILLRSSAEKAKEGLMEEKRVRENDIRSLELNRRNFVSRINSLIEDLDEKERHSLRRVVDTAYENRVLKEKILELQVENQKLKREKK